MWLWCLCLPICTASAAEFEKVDFSSLLFFHTSFATLPSFSLHIGSRIGGNDPARQELAFGLFKM